MNLTELSPEVKRELARSLWNKKKVKVAKSLEFWQPWTCIHGGTHSSQSKIFTSNARRRLVFGGNRSGKTEAGAADVAYMFLGTHPHRENRFPCIIKVLGETFTKIGEFIIPKLFKYIPASSIQRVVKNERGVVKRIEGVNGSIIDCMSYDQDVENFEGFDADMVWFDEPPKYKIWEGCRRGLIDRQGIELFTMTLLGEPWIYDKFYLPGLEGKLSDTEIIELYTECNPHIPPDEIEKLKEDYAFDEDLLNTRLFGKPRHLAGLVYKKFDRSIHVISDFDWPRDWPVYMCIDPHPKKPHAVTWLGVTEYDQLVVLDELKLGAPISELAVKIKNIETSKKYRIVDRLVDTSIKAIERTDQRMILAQAGLHCRFPHKHDRVLPGIEKVEELLLPKKDNYGNLLTSLVVRENCKGHIKEFMTYVWDETKLAPKKENDDYMDNVRYICDINPRFKYTHENLKYIKDFSTYGSKRAKIG